MLDALKLKNVDMDYMEHLQAFLNYQVQSTKKQGKKSVPVYQSFNKFFDYEKEIERASGKKPKPDKFSALSKYLKDKQKGEVNG